MALNDEDLRTALDLESDILKARGLRTYCGCSLRVLTRYPNKPWFLAEACRHLSAASTKEEQATAPPPLAWVSCEGFVVGEPELEAAYDAHWINSLGMNFVSMIIMTRDGVQITRNGSVRLGRRT